MDSIYDQIGGMAAVTATVDELHARVLADPQLAPYWHGVDMAAQRQHMRAFIATALGSGHEYGAGRPDMATAHAGLGVRGRDFDRVAEHLAGALRTVGVSSRQIAAILAAIAPLRDQIVGGQPAPV